MGVRDKSLSDHFIFKASRHSTEKHPAHVAHTVLRSRHKRKTGQCVSDRKHTAPEMGPAMVFSIRT